MVALVRVYLSICFACVNQHFELTHFGTSFDHRARDRPDKVFGIEIYDCFEYRRMRLHWNGCGLILHEFCHLIHQLVLQDGLYNQQVKQAFGLAKVSGLYDNVRRRDWAGQDEDFDLAYAMVDEKEFFAEMSVTYLAQGYRELDDKDKHRILLCSPPLMEPITIARVQKRLEIEPTYGSLQIEPVVWNGHQKSVGLFGGLFSRNAPSIPHCNKFYPFTRGQLQHHDPATLQVMIKLWTDIADWEDPTNNDCCWKLPTRPKTKTLLQTTVADPTPLISDTVSL